jgi:hypothetical protein
MRAPLKGAALIALSGAANRQMHNGGDCNSSLSAMRMHHLATNPSPIQGGQL